MIKITNHVGEEIKRYSAQHKYVDLCTYNPSERGLPRPELWAKVRAISKSSLYAILKERGYEYNDSLMQWEL